MRGVTGLAMALLGLAVSLTTALADTSRVRTVPDGQIRFDVSISGPTRISVVGDRIAKVLQSESVFEMVNDDGTGDVFLRFAGGEPQTESGYIVTESGVTIGFVMTPKVDLEMQTVLVTVTGARAGSAGSAQSSGFAVNAGAGETRSAASPAAGAPHTRTDELVAFVRAAHARRIADRSPARLRQGTHGTYASEGLKAKVIVAEARGGQAPRPETLSLSKRTLAVWVDDLVVGGKVWVIIVEGKI